VLLRLKFARSSDPGFFFFSSFTHTLYITVSKKPFVSRMKGFFMLSKLSYTVPNVSTDQVIR
jgi:hypothetical protein